MSQADFTNIGIRHFKSFYEMNEEEEAIRGWRSVGHVTDSWDDVALLIYFQLNLV